MLVSVGEMALSEVMFCNINSEVPFHKQCGRYQPNQVNLIKQNVWVGSTVVT